MLVKYTLTFHLPADTDYPLDMLRYDRCFPAHGPDVVLSARKPRELAVESVADNSWLLDERVFTIPRWRSFGVTPIAITKEKYQRSGGGQGWSAPKEIAQFPRPGLTVMNV
jgi:hypothetical protein